MGENRVSKPRLSPALIEQLRACCHAGEVQLSSGQSSGLYIDAKQVTYSPDGVGLVGRAIVDEIRAFGVDGIGGLTMGAEALIVSTIWASLSTSRPLFGFSVRKEPKQHGLGRAIEGVSPRSKRVAIVDDVITTGRSALIAAEAAASEGAEGAVIVGLVDREEGGRQACTSRGIPFRAVCKVGDLR